MQQTSVWPKLPKQSNFISKLQKQNQFRIEKCVFLDKNEREEGISFCVGKLRLSRFVNDQIPIEEISRNY